jgi:hypothetical protein
MELIFCCCQILREFFYDFFTARLSVCGQTFYMVGANQGNKWLMMKYNYTCNAAKLGYLQGVRLPATCYFEGLFLNRRTNDIHEALH